MLTQASGKLDLVPCLGLAERMPFGDGAFTKVIAVDSFHHFQDHELAARELLRVLTPGGRLVVEEPDIRVFSVKLVALGERIALMRSRFRPPDELSEIIRAADRDALVSVHESAPNYWLVVDKPGPQA
jgi:demethylmenaquinone methyltransferase/2-methoxy-6-polyprenyl-1,4-benzoquinol methylase